MVIGLMAYGSMVTGSMAFGMEASGKGETGGKGAMLSSCLLTHHQVTTRARQHQSCDHIL